MRAKLLLILIVFTVLTQLCTVSAFAMTNGEKNKGSILQDQCTPWNAPPEGQGRPIWDTSSNRTIQQSLQGQGQIRDLRNNPNLEGVNINELLNKTPRQWLELVKYPEVR